MPHKFWRREWKKGALPLLRSSLTYSPLMAILGVDAYTQSLRDCLVSPIPLPENSADMMTSAPSGPPSFEWWEKCSRSWFSSKTFLPFCDTSGQLETNYSDWATQLRSRCSSLPVLSGRVIGGNGFSHWPTAGAEDSESAGNHPGATDSLTGASRSWPTPNTPSGGPNTRSTETHTGGMDLDGKVLNWGTPTSRDHKDGASANTAPTNGLLGRQVIQNWPTPTKQDHARGAGTIREQDSGIPLNQRVAQVTASWPTPTEHDQHERHQPHLQGGHPLTMDAQNFLCSPPDLATPDGPPSSQNSPGSLPPSQRKRLNVCFVLWLMNFPFHWLHPEPMACARAEMQSYLFRQRLVLSSLLKGLD